LHLVRDHRTTSPVLSSKTRSVDNVPDNKFPGSELENGLNRRLNRRFRKQSGGLLIRGSEVRILPGA
jgi:hypothetical protein